MSLSLYSFQQDKTAQSQGLETEGISLSPSLFYHQSFLGTHPVFESDILRVVLHSSSVGYLAMDYLKRLIFESGKFQRKLFLQYFYSVGLLPVYTIPTKIFVESYCVSNSTL